MKYLLTLCLAMLSGLASHAQTVTELYQSKNYSALVLLEGKAESLTPDELYMIGFAFFRMENDEKALTFYNKAIESGLNKGYVHFYKGLSLRFLKRLDEAMAEVDIALRLEPANQEYMNEKGLIYYHKDDYPRALEVFEKAKTLPNTFPEPSYWIARIYHEQNKFSQALTAYYDAAKIIPQENSHYLKSLGGIGLLEYTYTNNFKKSAAAYRTAISMEPDSYYLYYKLIKSYNADKDYRRADSVFSLVKRAYDAGKLPEDDMKFKTVAVHEFQWKGQTVTVHRALEDPDEILDISYKVYLLNKDGDKIERRFMIEKTSEIGKGGVKHLLCEQDKGSGTHITYGYGWATEQIPIDDLQRAVGLVLDEKIKPGASSNFGGRQR